MKKQFALLFLFAPLFSSCFFLGGSDSSSESSLNSEPSSEIVGNSESVESSEQESSEPVDKPEEITIFSINDLHGSLKESASNQEPGIAKLSYAIKNDPDYDPETSIIVSCGDSWQGGFISHEEKTITDEILSLAGIEVMCLGNHEFDWGIDTIKELKEQSPYPYLACNIQNPNGKVIYDLSDPSTIIEKSGVKVGFIGVMGPNLESSISTKALENYSFSDDIRLVDAEYEKLNEQGVDLIVVLAHDSASDSSYLNSIGNKYKNTEIQGIFGGHTHTFEKMTAGVNKIPFLQAGCNSKGYSKMTFSTQVNVCKTYNYNSSVYYECSDLDASLLDQNIVTKIAEADSKYRGNEPLCTFNGDFRRYHELSEFIPWTMYEEAKYYNWEGENDLLAIHNNAGIRSDIESGVVTREKLFKTEPFDNAIKVIQNVSGSDLSRVLGTVDDNFNTEYYCYYTTNGQRFDSSKTYDVVTIDFVSEGKYFKHITQTQHNLDKENSTSPIYIFTAIVDFLNRGGNKTYNAADFG